MASRSGVTSTRARIKLRRILTETDARIKPVIQDAANSLLKEIMGRVPTDTGNLKNSITAKVAKNGLSAEVGIRGKKAKRAAYYGRFVEFGTKGKDGANRTAAQPFMEPAWDSEKPKIINDVERVIRKAVKEASNK